MRPSRGMGAINPDKQPRSIKKRDGNYPVEIFAGGGDVSHRTPAWQRKEGQNPDGGLNAKGRASAKKQGMNLKPPQPEGGSRRDSFCARMTGMKEKLTGEKAKNDPDSRINKSLRAWKC